MGKGGERLGEEAIARVDNDEVVVKELGFEDLGMELFGLGFGCDEECVLQKGFEERES